MNNRRAPKMATRQRFVTQSAFKLALIASNICIEAFAMRKISLLLSLSVAVFGALMLSPAAFAQATRTWVSGVGDDANPCSRTAPCKTFAGAISKTAASGEINCLDPGGFGAVTITKAISLVCESLEAGVLVSGTNGISVSAGANDIVTLRGLDIVGIGTGLDGIKFNSGAVLRVEKCTIRGFLGAPGNGIHFAPNSASQLYVYDSIISDNNMGGTSAGILVQPSGSGMVGAIIDHVQMANNGNGLVVDGTLSSATQISVVVRDSVAAGSAFSGIKANSAAGNAPVRVVVDRTTVATNATGITSTGSGADVTVGYSVVGANTTGVSFTAPGNLRSYLTNELRGNVVSNGTTSSTIPVE